MNKTIIVTGAAKNIGKGILKTLIDAGYSCIAVDIDQAALTDTINALDAGERCQEYVLDVGNIDAINKFLDWLKNGQIHFIGLINNAAYESPVRVAEITPEELSKSFKTNLEGPLYLTSKIANEWISSDTKGNVLFTSSVHSQITRTHSLYSSSKAAIEMFVKEAALEFGKHGIRVNAVAPGPTQDTENLKADYRVPMGYYQQPEDIAKAVKFLLSDDARFITGQTLRVDGGFSLTFVHHWMNEGKLPDSTKQ